MKSLTVKHWLLLALALQGCEFKINSLLGKATIPLPNDEGFRRPIYPEAPIDGKGHPALILIGDLAVSKSNVVFDGTPNPAGPIADQLRDIRSRFSTSNIVLVGGWTTYNSETTLAGRQTVASNLAWIRSNFPMISTGAAWGPDEPGNESPNEGAARLCAALDKLGSGSQPPGSTTPTFDYTPPGQDPHPTIAYCRNKIQSPGHFASVVAANSDYDFGTSRPLVMDIRNPNPLQNTVPSWKMTNPATDPNGIVDASTQLFFLCDQTFKNHFSWLYHLGSQWMEKVRQTNGEYTDEPRSYALPKELGSQRFSPLILAGNPFSTNPLDFDPNAAMVLRNFIANNFTIPIVFVKNKGQESLTAPSQVTVGTRTIWVVPVSSLNPPGGTTQSAYTAVYLARSKALIKHVAPLTGNVLATYDLTLSTPVDFTWKNRAATSGLPTLSGTAPVCCRLDALLRPSTPASTVFRTTTLNGILSTQEGADCGALNFVGN